MLSRQQRVASLFIFDSPSPTVFSFGYSFIHSKPWEFNSKLNYSEHINRQSGAIISKRRNLYLSRWFLEWLCLLTLVDVMLHSRVYYSNVLMDWTPNLSISTGLVRIEECSKNWTPTTSALMAFHKLSVKTKRELKVCYDFQDSKMSWIEVSGWAIEASHGTLRWSFTTW